MTQAKKKPTMTRRRFLRDLGVSAAAVPLLAGLDSLYAKAQVPSVPKKRFVHMYTPNGIYYSAWRLPQPGTSIDITANGGALLNSPARTQQPLYKNASKLLLLDRLSLIGARYVYNERFSNPPVTVNGVTIQPSSADGLNHPGAGQKAVGNLLTGQVLTGGSENFGNAGLANGISVDQVIANQLFKGNVMFPSLQLAVMGTNDLYGYADRMVEKVLSYTAPTKPLTPISDPFVLYRTLFVDPTMPQSAVNLRLLMDKTVLDGVQADFTRLHPKVSSADWQILQQHQQAVRDIETQLTSVAKVSCTMPVPPMASGVNTADAMATLKWTEMPGIFPIAGGMMINLLAQALACGLTNVVTLQWAHEEDNLSYPWVNLPPSQSNLNGVGHHNMLMERDPNLIFIDQWYASQFNSLINLMSAIPDSGTNGSLLDNSVLMHAAAKSQETMTDNGPITLAGSNGGYFKQGLLLRFNDVFTPLPIPPNSDPSSYFLTNAWYTNAVQIASQDQYAIGSPDLSNNDLFASILDSFGLDITTVAPSMADPRFFHGLLPGVKVGT